MPKFFVTCEESRLFALACCLDAVLEDFDCVDPRMTTFLLQRVEFQLFGEGCRCDHCEKNRDEGSFRSLFYEFYEKK